MDLNEIDQQHERLDRILENNRDHEALANQAGWSLTRRLEWFREQGYDFDDA